MRTTSARRRAVIRPAAALGALSLAAIGLTALPAGADTDGPEAPGVTDELAGDTDPSQGASPEGDEAPEGEGPADAAEEPAAEEDSEAAGDEGGVEVPETGQAGEATEQGAVQPLVEEDGTVVVDLVHFGDFHGALSQAPYMATMIDELRAQNPDTFVVSTGDIIGGSTFESAIQQDQPSIDVLNALGLEMAAVGNHEFDQGWADLRDRVILGEEGNDPAAWNYLGANVAGADLIEGENGVEIVEVGDASIAFIGTVTDDTPRVVSSSGIEGLTFGDPVAVTNQIAADLKAGGVDAVVALAHESHTIMGSGLSADVDVAFSGHTHHLEDGTIAASGGPLLESGSSGSHLGHVTLTIDPAGEVSAESHGNLAVAGVEPREDVQAIVDAAFAEAEELGQEQVGTVAAPIYGGSNDGSPATPGEDPANRGTESPLGNLLGHVAAETARAMDMEVDFGIINPGGIRAELDPNEDGIVTYAEAFGVHPFGNTVATIDLTGAQVVAMLQQQFQPGEGRPMLRLGLSEEVFYLYEPAADPTEESGQVTGVWIHGEPIDLDATYTVASNNFLLEGNDGFTVLAEGENYTDTGWMDVQGLIDYLAQNPDLVPDHTQRSVGMTWISDPEQEFTGGEEIEIELASLSHTIESDPRSEEVTVLEDGEPLVTAPVDNTITPNTDETGRATVAWNVPENLSEHAEAGRIVYEITFGATEDSQQTLPPLILEIDGDGGGGLGPEAPEIAVNPTSVAAGGTVEVTGTGFGAEEELTLELRSTPVELAVVSTGADGSFTTEVTIPADVEPGEHTMVAILPSGDEVTATLTVLPVAGGPGSGGPGAAGSLPTTGADMDLALPALAFLTLGAAALAVAHRRRQEV